MTVLPGTVTTTRLRLPLLTRAQADDLGSGTRHPSFAPGFPRPDDLAAASMVRDGDPWGPRLVVRGVDGLVCGTVGFFGGPEDVDGQPEAEIGFGLVPDARGRGVASEAVAALLELTDAAGVRVRAAVRPENAPCLKLLAARGFTQLRGSTEDGELVMVRPVPAGATS